MRMPGPRLYLDAVSDMAEVLDAQNSPSWWLPLLGTAAGVVWVVVQLCRFLLMQTGPAVWLDQLPASSMQMLSTWVSGWVDRLWGVARREFRR